MSNPPVTQSTQEELWAGIDLKHDHAQFHLERMSAALRPPEPTAYDVIMESHGGSVSPNWHRPFYAHLDAFLSAARSIPELIRCCFGYDTDGRMRDWFAELSAEEQDRRKLFSERFRDSYVAFRQIPLGTARHDSEHRRGYPPACVTTIGLLGITYVGTPITRLPTSETRRLPAEYGWMERPRAVRPLWSDFQINGEPLFATCQSYVAQSQTLIEGARIIAQEVHGSNEVTPPQSDV